MTVFTSSKPTFNDDNCQKLVFSLAPAYDDAFLSEGKK